ncbi:MAG TPA: hypothetical protein PKK99_14390 [Bacteroidia bacterium]|nr:hypothetical protein [Bacteroidia bacterium]
MKIKIPVLPEMTSLLCLLFLLQGCGAILDNNSIVDIHYIRNMKADSLVKLRDISQGDWDIVCVLTPYEGGLRDYGDERIKLMDSKISELNLSISETGWHLLFEKEGIVGASSIRPGSRTKMHSWQNNLRPEIIKILNEQSFNPKTCVPSDQAAIYKIVRADVVTNEKYEDIIFGEIKE